MITPFLGLKLRSSDFKTRLNALKRGTYRIITYRIHTGYTLCIQWLNVGIHRINTGYTCRVFTRYRQGTYIALELSQEAYVVDCIYSHYNELGTNCNFLKRLGNAKGTQKFVRSSSSIRFYFVINRCYSFQMLKILVQA